MAEYIEREEYCEKHCRCDSEYCDKPSCPIWKAPAADVAPVRHGRWIIANRHTVSSNPYMDDSYFASATCSECGFCIHSEIGSFAYPNLNTTNYCPNCGAKMDLEEN